MSFALITVVSLPLGLLTANGRLDGLHTAVNQFCMAVPPFFTGILISWVFGITLHTFVPGDFPGLRENFGRSLVYLFSRRSPSPSPGGYDGADASQHGHS